MKTITTSVGIAVLILVLPSCAGTPAKESEWNRVGIWDRVGDDPPTYVPVGYAASRPRTEREGEWFVDRRDGKRLFVPNATVGSLLTGEAMKVTGVKPKKSARTALEDGTSGFVYGLLMTLAAMGSGGGGGGYGGGCHH